MLSAPEAASSSNTSPCHSPLGVGIGQLVRIALAPDQPIVLRDEDGRLHGGGGATCVAVTMDRVDTNGIVIAEAVVPTDGKIQVFCCSFDAVSHLVVQSIPLNADCSALEGMLKDAHASVDVLTRLGKIHRETAQALQDPSDDLPSNEAHGGSIWNDGAVSGAWNSKVELRDLKLLRQHNDTHNQHVIQVMRDATGPAFIDSMLRARLASAIQHQSEYKNVRRRRVDSQYASRVADGKKIPAERKRIIEQERHEVQVLEDARSKLSVLGESIAKLVAETQSQFDEIQGQIALQKERHKELERHLMAMEAEAVSPSPPARRASMSRTSSSPPGGRASMSRIPSSPPGQRASKSDDRRIEMREELWKLKADLRDSEAKHVKITKLVLEGPKKEQLAQQNRVWLMEKEQQRNVEVIRKKRRKLDDRLKASNEAIAEVEEKRMTLETEFRRELIDIVAIDGAKEEATLLSAVQQQLRRIQWASLRRYAAGQLIVVRVPTRNDESVHEWKDAVVEGAAAWSYAHRVRLSDGSQLTLTLHPFNHAVRLLECSAWDELRQRYYKNIRDAYVTVPDPLTQTARRVLELCIPLERVDSGEIIDVHVLSEEVHRSYLKGGDLHLGGERYPAPSTMLVDAPVGAGKTCLLQQLAVLAIEKEALVPIIIRMSDLQQHLANDRHRPRFTSSWNFIDAYLQCLCVNEKWAMVYPMLRQAMISRRTLLLLDGVDEAGQATETLCMHVVEVLRAQGHAMVVSCRPATAAAAQWPGFTRIRVKPLSLEEQKEFMSERLRSTAWSIDALVQYQAQHLPDCEASSERAISSPLLLSMLTSLVEAQSASSSGGAELPPLPTTASDLYGVWIRSVLDNLDTNLPVGDVLGIAALHAHAAKVREMSIVDLKQGAHELVRMDKWAGAHAEIYDAVEMIQQLVADGCFPLLTMLQVEPLKFQFAHISFQEYLFVTTACEGFLLPKGMEMPWQWSGWWKNTLSFGIGVGDAFSNGLLEGCRRVNDVLVQEDEEQVGYLDLTRQIGILASENEKADNFEAASPMRKPAVKDEIMVGVEAIHEELSLARLADRSISISAVAELAKHATSLKLAWNNLTDGDVLIIATGIRPRTLTELDVSNNQLGDVGMKTLVGALAAGDSGSALRTLFCAHNGVGAQGATALAHLFGVSKRLTQLDLRGNNIIDEGLCALGRELLRKKDCPLSYLRCNAFDLSKTTTRLQLKPFLDASAPIILLSGALLHTPLLTQLDMYDSTLNIEASSALATAMHEQRIMTTLKLTRVRLGDKGMLALSQGLKARRNLQTLHLESCGIGPSGAKSLAASLHGMSSLTSLGVSCSLIRDAGVQVLVDAASAVTSLVSLNLAETGASTVGFKSIANLILKSTSLTFIDITKNDLRGDGMRAMGDAILQSCSDNLRFLRCDAFDISEGVTELRLRGRNLIAGTALMLAGLACHNTDLVSLDVQHNGLGPNGAEALAQAFKRSSLTQLNAAQNFMEPTGLTTLGRAIGLSNTLTALDLSSNLLCGINSEGAGRHTTAAIKVLAASVGKSQLVQLKLEDNGLEVSGAKMLAPALRACTTLRKISLARNNLTLYGLNPTGVAEIVLHATAGSQSKLSGDYRDLDMSDNHLNKRALAWPPPPSLMQGITHARAIRIEAPRCTCDYCLMYDEVQGHCKPTSNKKPFAFLKPAGEAETSSQGKRRSVIAMLDDLKAMADSKLGTGAPVAPHRLGDRHVKRRGGVVR